MREPPRTAETSTTKVGQRGEDVAVEFLRKQGFRIANRNVQTARGEIDIVAWQGEVLCFVEVKARSYREFGGGAIAVDSTKQQRLWKAAEAYMALNDELWGDPPECRFDVVSIQTRGLEDGASWECELFQGAFSPGASR